MKRKDFIKTCGAYCAAGAGITSLMESCASANYYAVNIFESNQLVVKKSEFIYLTNKEKKVRPFVLVKNEKLEFPIGLYQFGENEYLALSLKCTHQGCEVHPYDDYLVCPCHGSEYSNRGKVLQPPAEINLKEFHVSVSDDIIFIQL